MSNHVKVTHLKSKVKAIVCSVFVFQVKPPPYYAVVVYRLKFVCMRVLRMEYIELSTMPATCLISK